jgi:uncharacterized membrane protein
VRRWSTVPDRARRHDGPRNNVEVSMRAAARVAALGVVLSGLALVAALPAAPPAMATERNGDRATAPVTTPVATPVAATATTPTGLYLTTRYPALSVRAGDTTTIDLELDNYGLPPQRVALDLGAVPAGWKATLLGGGQPIAAAMVKPNGAQNLQLRLESQADARPGTYSFTVEASTADGKTQRLPIDVTIGKAVPAKLKLTASLPELRGAPTAAFKFRTTVVNDSGRDAVIDFATDLPKTFDVSVTEAYGTQQLAGLPVKAGQSKDLDVSVTPARDTKAGQYAFKLTARTDQATTTLPLSMDIVGQPHVSLSGEGERLSAAAYAGSANPINLIVRNSGSETAQQVALSASTPEGWKTEFDPKVIPQIAPGGQAKVVAMVTPSDRAIAGDYQASFTATPKGQSGDSSDFRITVETSTLWGIVGVAVIGAALVVVALAVFRFGRR